MNNTLFYIAKDKASSWSAKYRITNIQILDELKRRGAPKASLDEVTKAGFAIVSDLSESDLLMYTKTDPSLTRTEIKAKLLAAAVDECYKELLFSQPKQPTQPTKQPEQEAVFKDIYTAPITDELDADETIIDIDKSSLTEEQQSYVDKLLEGGKQQLRTRASKVDMSKKFNIDPTKLGYFIVDTISKTGKGAMRKGVRPKYLNLEAGEMMPSAETFKEFFDMFLLVPHKEFNQHTMSIPISNSAVYNAATTLQLPLFWFQTKVPPNYIVMRDKAKLNEFLGNHPEFTRIVDSHEFPEELRLCIILFNTIHVAGHMHLAKAIPSFGEAIEDAVVNEYDEVRAEFYRASLMNMRAAINKGKGKEVVEVYKSLIEDIVNLPTYDFLPPLTDKIKERMENGKTK